jgi:hypothetical protein
MTLEFATVAYTLATLEVAGLSWQDIDEIPEEVGVRGDAFMIPLPDFMTNFDLEQNSYGGGSTALQTAYYSVGYRLCYEPVGTNVKMTLKQYEGLLDMVGLILDRVIIIDVFNTSKTEVVDVTPVSVTNFGVVTDPADKSFFGADFEFEVTEFIN